ncbi:hypothetical protein [Fimbriiglobus ruber]|uniref:Uncharacterized protein n=1 Tax=Fimbriiglobus ruber TaxID=1908690 RepID=A0A225DC05_9BACT|nr:hypothetical protein [Fimbriiglobus ruber]OWK38523.1 hypothetical protein FRUB_07643 [Fimbriiglobus ruber]
MRTSADAATVENVGRSPEEVGLLARIRCHGRTNQPPSTSHT